MLKKQLKKLEKHILKIALENKEFAIKLVSELTIDDYLTPTGLAIHKWLTKQINDDNPISDIACFTDLYSDYPDIEEYTAYDIEGDEHKGEYYLSAYIEKLHRSRLEASLKSVMTKISSEPLESVLNAIEGIFNGLYENEKKQEEYKPNELREEFVLTLAERIENQKHIIGLQTGFDKLDFYLNGLRGGNLIVLAGRTSMGKSTLAMQIAFNIAMQDNTVLYFHQEASKDEVMAKLASLYAGVPYENINKAMLNPIELNKIDEFFKQDIPIHFNFKAGVTIEYIKQRARHLALKHKLGLIVVDHLQFMRMPKAGNTNEAVGLVTKELLELAKKYDCPVLLLSQLNRLADRENRPPRNSDLRDSGNIEQDAHIVMFVERGFSDNPKARLKRNEARVYITKNRNGQVGVAIPMRFDPYLVKFIEEEK